MKRKLWVWVDFKTELRDALRFIAVVIGVILIWWGLNWIWFGATHFLPWPR